MTFKVPGMMCMHCVKSVSEVLNSLDGVCDVQVDLATKSVTLQADESMKDTILRTIEDIGFDVE